MTRRTSFFAFLARCSLQTKGSAGADRLLAELRADSAGCHRLTATAGSSWLATKCVGSKMGLARQSRRPTIWALSAEARS